MSVIRWTTEKELRGHYLVYKAEGHQALGKRGSETDGRWQRQQGGAWGSPSSSSLCNKDTNEPISPRRDLKHSPFPIHQGMRVHTHAGSKTWLATPNSSLRFASSRGKIWENSHASCSSACPKLEVGFQGHERPLQNQRRIKKALWEVGSSTTQQQVLIWSLLHQAFSRPEWHLCGASEPSYCLVHIQTGSSDLDSLLELLIV